MKFDLSEIKLSRKDVLRGLRFPSEMSEQLAEDIGIMIGDGCISTYKSNNLTNNFNPVDVIALAKISTGSQKPTLR